jgi:hypothetical protein
LDTSWTFSEPSAVQIYSASSCAFTFCRPAVCFSTRFSHRLHFAVLFEELIEQHRVHGIIAHSLIGIPWREPSVVTYQPLLRRVSDAIQEQRTEPTVLYRSGFLFLCA